MTSETSAPTSSPLREKLRAGLVRCGAAGQRILLAVSGGADSVALFRGCLDLAASLRHTLCIAHYNHRLRGDESEADARWIETLAAHHQTQLVVGEHPTSRSPDSSGIEEAARNERYAFLRRAAGDLGCQFVATAHTADDQAETVLHHIFRGTSLTGLRGIRAQRPLAGTDESAISLIRPMLSIRRAEVIGWLSELGQDFRTDSTNADVRFTRNRIRHELLPLLAERYSPTVVESLLRLSAAAADAEDAITLLAERLLDQAIIRVEAGPDAIFLDCTPFTSQPRHVVRECFVRLWVRRGWPRHAMSFAHWDALAELALRPRSATEHSAITLPGSLSARRRRMELTVAKTVQVGRNSNHVRGEG